jgi:hypothetical protein
MPALSRPGGALRSVFWDSPWGEYMFFRHECKKKEEVFEKKFLHYFQ